MPGTFNFHAECFQLPLEDLMEVRGVEAEGALDLRPRSDLRGPLTSCFDSGGTWGQGGRWWAETCTGGRAHPVPGPSCPGLLAPAAASPCGTWLMLPGSPRHGQAPVRLETAEPPSAELAAPQEDIWKGLRSPLTFPPLRRCHLATEERRRGPGGLGRPLKEPLPSEQKPSPSKP